MNDRSETLTRRGVRIEDPERIARAKRELTVSPLTFDASPFPKKYEMFSRVAGTNHVVVPVFWARDAGIRIRDERTPGVPQKNLRFVGTLREALHQPAAAEAVEKSLRECGGAVLSLPTGHGKTSLAIWIAVRTARKTMILVHKNFLADQFEERIRKHVPAATVTRVQGSEFDIGGDFVIVMIQTLVTRRYDASAFEPFGMLIVDECHHVPAESFSRALLGGLAFPRVLGLSATPTRKDGLGRVMHWFLGPMAFSHVRTGQRDVTVEIARFEHPSFADPPPLNRRGDVDYAGLVTRLVDLRERTAFVAERAGRLARGGRRVLVLSHRRGHARAIADVLKAEGVDAATYLGGDKTPPECAVTCATFALASEGYDDPRLNALVLATPSSDVDQACGRVMRNGGGLDPVVVDVVDRYSMMFSQFAKRRAFYKRTGFTIVDECREADGVRDPSETRDIMFVDDDD